MEVESIPLCYYPLNNVVSANLLFKYIYKNTQNLTLHVPILLLAVMEEKVLFL